MSEEGNKMSSYTENNEMETKMVIDPPTHMTLLKYCLTGNWNAVMACVEQHKGIALEEMKSKNGASTTLLHQAISARKGDALTRADVILTILKQTPKAALLKNAHSSYPLHAVLQRNTKLRKKKREEIVRRLIEINEAALHTTGGAYRRFPLHILFTDYVGPKLTKEIIDKARFVVSERDKKGWLPAHIACSRYCSPRKLEMLLDLYPEALTAETPDKETLFSLACEHTTGKRHNRRLKELLKRKLQQGGHWTSAMADMERIPPGKIKADKREEAKQKEQASKAESERKRKPASPQVDGSAKKRKRKSAGPKAKKVQPAARVARAVKSSAGSKPTSRPSLPLKKRPIDAGTEVRKGAHALLHFTHSMKDGSIAGPRGPVVGV